MSIPADREYKYEELLDRMYSLLVANNPELAGDRKRFLMKPPQVVREGSKRVVVINFGDICKTLNRSIDHVYAFMLAEMGTTGSIDASNRMVIKGRFTPKAIEQLIRRYVGEYVTCSSCKSPQTTMQKQNRLYFMQCNNCPSALGHLADQDSFVVEGRGANVLPMCAPCRETSCELKAFVVERDRRHLARSQSRLVEDGARAPPG